MKKITLLLLTTFCIGAGLQAQSLLTEPPLPPAQARALRATANAQGLRDSILGGLRHSITDLWSGDYEQDVATATALGNKGAELFALYENFTTAVRALLVGAGDTDAVAQLDAIMALVPEQTINEDGTITIVAPEPEIIDEPEEN